MNQKGFTLVELVVSIGVISLLFVLANSFVVVLKFAGGRLAAQETVVRNAGAAMQMVGYETRQAIAIYTPTTTAHQLSLQTPRYLYGTETFSFIDFFVCGTALCFKQEGQNPVAITDDSVSVDDFSVAQINNGSAPSVQFSLTVSYKNPNGLTQYASSITLTSSDALRNHP